jgi:hypothetical protein
VRREQVSGVDTRMSESDDGTSSKLLHGRIARRHFHLQRCALKDGVVSVSAMGVQSQVSEVDAVRQSSA